MLNRELFAGALLIAYAGSIQAQMVAPVDSALASTPSPTKSSNRPAPKASVAVVKNSRVAYANAYGAAKLDPRVPATPDLRYAIGSISSNSPPSPSSCCSRMENSNSMIPSRASFPDSRAATK